MSPFAALLLGFFGVLYAPHCINVNGPPWMEEDHVMKLYYAPGACSLSPHIVSREAGINLDLEQVDNREKKTKTGKDYWGINPKGQVQVLELDNGQRLTEGPVIVQYLADQKPASGLVPSSGSIDRYRVQEWLNFVTSELHKTYGPIFRPTTPDEYKKISKESLGKRFDWIDEQLAGKQYLMGDKFAVADAYLFTVLRWSPRIDVDLSKWPNIKAYMDRVAPEGAGGVEGGRLAVVVIPGQSLRGFRNDVSISAAAQS
jgi:glutathione S-transferase